MRPVLLTGLLLGGASMMSACVSFDYGDSPFTCSEDKRCPAGYQCRSGRCEAKQQDASPDRPHDGLGRDLDQTTMDGGAMDGETIDSMTDVNIGDTSGDAPTDGETIDSMTDISIGDTSGDAPTDASGTTNLLVNPGFEQGSTGWTLNNAVVVSNGGANGSTHAMRVEATGAVSQRGASQLIEGISPGDVIHFKAWAKVEQTITADGTARPQGGLRWKTGAGVLIDGEDDHVDPNLTGWQLLEITAIAPPGAEKVDVLLFVWEKIKSGVVRYDEVELEILSP